MKRIKPCYLLFLVFTLLGCREKYNLKIGTFPDEQPINLIDLNSPFDEMNSDFVSPYLSANVNLIFSSNANTKGNNFDLNGGTISFNQSKETEVFTFLVSKNLGQNEVLRNQLFEINSECEERGPYSIGPSSGIFYTLFSRDCDGVSHIFFNEFEKTGSFEYRSETFQVTLSNENVSEMYPSFFGKNYLKGEPDQGTPQKMLFSSNRDGSFDIYETDIPLNQGVIDFFKTENEKQIKKIEINTSSNDHMPFVYGDLLVFSSDRPGGFGGYDLYYTQKSSTGWTDPVNFGPKINSEFDEYRPVVSDSWEYSNQVMIFSSNRPGGLGGFDLYFVGIPKI